MKLVLPLALMLTVTTTSDAQSLRELAARGSKPDGTFSADVPVLSIAEIVRLSDLVVYGHIGKIETRLVSGDSLVATEYTVTPVHILKGQPHGVNALAPGPTEPIVVQNVGGTLIEGDTRFRTYVESFPEREAFTMGEQVVMFLVYNADIGRYQLTDGPYAAFRLTKDGVMPMTKKAAEKRGDTPRPLAAFLAELQQEIQRKP